MEKLFIDLDKCRSCKSCAARCSYYYHKDNNGINSLIEHLTFSVICRKCEEAPCIASCYHEALFKLDDGRIKRSNFLCTSCKSCYLACPFGTILPEMLDYISPNCDVCIEKKEPSCVKSCPYGALEVKEIEKEDEQNGIFFVGEKFAVKTTKWFKEGLVLRQRKKK